MNLDGKQDLDALLKTWPAPAHTQDGAANEQDEERSWDERAEAVVRAALASTRAASPNALNALMDAPALTPEPGEGADPSSIVPALYAVATAGEKKMSQEKEPGDFPASTATPPPTERKRTSLKEIAARASQSGARLSSSGIGTPAPSSVTSAGRSPGATPLPRPVEAARTTRV